MDRADLEPIVGCTKISAGCKNCYAETLSRRLKAMGTAGYENGFALTLLPSRLEEPLKRKKPTTYFQHVGVFGSTTIHVIADHDPVALDQERARAAGPGRVLRIGPTPARSRICVYPLA